LQLNNEQDFTAVFLTQFLMYICS